ncbi:unnamed protein product, partial [Mesorhabditis belari]|uniref:RUN domain-containing protein n=1 Tax=Mesorhabditis belari TaxID=2138241 RepID=A0AAF3F6F2_9BILA
MVELCELKMLPDADEWPPDIDDRIANLDFGASDSLFGSLLDGTVSTDSLDSEQLRQRCQYNKEDYKITMADSGQWASMGQSGRNGFTTWGRIHSQEPLDERFGSKTASAPDIGMGTSRLKQRPSSLLATFSQRQSTLDPDLGLVLDVNDNEVTTTPGGAVDRWQAARPTAHPTTLARSPAGQKPRRTFADLTPSTPNQQRIHKNAPELQFLQLPHQMPTLCESSMSFSDIMIRLNDGKDGKDPPETLPFASLLPNITKVSDLNLLSPLQLEDSPDSGIGCSGPIHIEDWSSLSVLLPSHVAEACSFFKQNTNLLGTSSQHSNCIEGSRKLPEPCRTCFRVRRRLHPPHWAQNSQSRHILCDCTASEIVERAIEFAPRPTRSLSSRPSLAARELSVVGLPIYAAKRTLVEAVVEGVAAVLRGDGASTLVAGMICLVQDGLRDRSNAWKMITTLTAPGPATKDVYSIVKDLNASNEANDRKVEIFFEELLRECSLDCWLCYVILKENVLNRLYREGAFLLSAPSAYRSLLWRLVESLELLSSIEARSGTRSMFSCVGASRLASDSRVPKSSSVPARLSFTPRQRSRIPLPLRRPCYSSSKSRSPSRSSHRMASILTDSNEPGYLAVRGGEKVRILSKRGEMARCERLHPLRNHVVNGIVPVANLALH